MQPTALPDGAVVVSLTEAMDAFDPHATYRPYVWVEGEISDVSRARSGHTYLTISDGDTSIPAVLWERVARGIPVRAEDGLMVAVHGWIQKHPQRSHLELDVRDLIIRAPRGPRRRALEELKERLAAEGLLEPGRKRRLPLDPSCIGIVTSSTGDVLHDIARILQRRAPGVRTELAPARVTGQAAAAEIASAIRSLSDSGRSDLVILARGGGSSADLAAYDTEAVARAVAACRVPLISAVGHEPDVTLADLVADVRCATPSEAAEIAVRERTASHVEADCPVEVTFQVGGATITVRTIPAATA